MTLAKSYSDTAKSVLCPVVLCVCCQEEIVQAKKAYLVLEPDGNESVKGLAAGREFELLACAQR